MKIGIDVSLETCRKEGYLMMEFKKRELFPKGVFDADCFVRIFSHYPDYALEEMYGSENPVGVSTILTDVAMSANALWEIYMQHKEGIDSFAGLTHEFPTDEYSFLSLASDINSYCGLE